MAASGERLYRGEHISLQVTNNSGRDLYVGLFDIDTAYNITLISNDEPAGWRLRPGQTKTIGGTDGVPPGVGRRRARRRGATGDAPGHRRHPTAAVRRVDHRRNATRARPAAAARLESLLAEAGTGTRGWPAKALESVAYCAKPVDFYLVPAPPPSLGEPPFAIEDLPDRTTRGCSLAAPSRLPRAWRCGSSTCGSAQQGAVQGRGPDRRADPHRR